MNTNPPFNNNIFNLNNNGIPMNNNRFFMGNNGMFLNNHDLMNQAMLMNNDFNFFNNFCMNNNMSMNMFNLMMYYLLMCRYNSNNNTGSNPQNNNKINNINNNWNRMTFIIPNLEERNSNNPNVFGGILPRGRGIDHFNAFPEQMGNKINIFFQAPTGFKTNMLVPDNTKIKDVLVKYVMRIGLLPEVIDKAIYFLFGGNKIKKNDKRTVREMYMIDGAVVIVIDKKGVIGA